MELEEKLLLLSEKEVYALALNALKAKEAVLKYQKNNHALRLLNTCKHSSTKRGLEFNLELSDIIIPDICPFLGLPISNELGKGRQKTNASIDRIDTSLGYIKGNVRVCSDLANRMKSNATQEELVAFAKGVLSIYEY